LRIYCKFASDIAKTDLNYKSNISHVCFELVEEIRSCTE
jgi:hypothetical protein